MWIFSCGGIINVGISMCPPRHRQTKPWHVSDQISVSSDVETTQAASKEELNCHNHL